MAATAKPTQLALFLALFVFLAGEAHPEGGLGTAPGPYTRFSKPDFPTFNELVDLSSNPNPSSPLRQKIDKLWRTPIISNEAYYRGSRPRALEDPRLGKFLRVATWNIEKSLEIKNAVTAFTDVQGFQVLIDESRVQPGSKEYAQVLDQRARLAQSDIILLQEMDIGVKRSNYVDGARTLAEALDMNYAYAPEYLEVDPAYLGLEKIKFEDGELDEEAMAYFRLDRARYKGLFGSAVLSRYPIRSVIVFPLASQAYDWYTGEKEKTTFLEKSRRFGAKTVFKSRVHRELKVGNRVFFRVDLVVPGLPHDTLTIINIHLEIKCLPEARAEQMDEILSYLKEIKNPVIVGGDFNSAPTDLSPTSVTRTAVRTVKNPSTWLGVGIRQFSPHAMAVNATRVVSNVSKNLQDPTAKHIPVVAPNPTAKMFGSIEDFRFDDGGAFDFRGDAARSTGGETGTLANANQRDRVGYKTTFELKRTLARVIGKYRLDWFFVKSFLKEPRDVTGSYRFAPHFGATLEEMNNATKQQISDHHTNVIDLPFDEPNIRN